MANVIKLKRATVASRVPTTSDLADGEVAINLTDKKIYVNNGGSIVEVANADTTAGKPGSFTTLTASGATTLDGDVTLGDATGDDITFAGYVASHIIPKTNDTYDLGTSSLRWRTAYLAASTIDLGGSTISSDGTGTITISSSGVDIPAGSQIGSDNIPSASTATAVLLRSSIPFYKTGDLSSSNATFEVKASGGGERIFDDFTLATGSAITTQTNTLFSF